MTSQKYNSIISETMIPFDEETMVSNQIFQHDNDQKHTSKLIEETLQRRTFHVLHWPNQNPNPNPIEHLWEELDRAFRVKKYWNSNDFFAVLQEAWIQLPLEKRTVLVNSMPRRLLQQMAIQPNIKMYQFVKYIIKTTYFITFNFFRLKFVHFLY